MQYIISEFPPREAIGHVPTVHVYAPPGHMREGGKVVRDGSPLKSGPEWGKDSTKAYRFHSHRSAAWVLSKCGPRARIVTLKTLASKQLCTYTVSVHEGQDTIRPEHGCQPGWIRVEEEVPHMGLREVIRTLREEGYTDEAILVESECAKPTRPANRDR